MWNRRGTPNTCSGPTWAGEQTGCRAGGGLPGGKDPAGRFSFESILAVGNAEPGCFVESCQRDIESVALRSARAGRQGFLHHAFPFVVLTEPMAPPESQSAQVGE